MRGVKRLRSRIAAGTPGLSIKVSGGPGASARTGGRQGWGSIFPLEKVHMNVEAITACGHGGCHSCDPVVGPGCPAPKKIPVWGYGPPFPWQTLLFNTPSKCKGPQDHGSRAGGT